MGIAGVEPRQLAPIMGTTGSGSTDSPAPSPTIDNLTASTRFDGPTSAMAVDSASPLDIDSAINFDTGDMIDIEFTIDTAVGIAPTVIETNAKINVDSAIDTAVGITMLIIVNTISPETEVDIAGSAVIDTASPSTADLTPAAIIIDPTSSTAGAVSAVTGGFDMAFRLFNFHVNNDGVAELISISDLTPPAAAPSTSPVIEGNPSSTIPLASSEEEPRQFFLTPSVGSNDFENPPPSPTTAYYVDCDVYHYVGIGDFSSHEIADCEDPWGGALQLSTRRYLNVSGLSTPSRFVLRPMTLIMSKGCTRTTHAQTTTMTFTPKPGGDR
jgi:hypothetical protein